MATIASKGEFLQFAVGRQILHRLSTDMEAHGGFPGYYPVVSALVFYPWSALLPAAMVGAWARRKADPLSAISSAGLSARCSCSSASGPS